MKTDNQHPKTSKTFEGFLWLFSSSGAQSALQLGVTAILARLLSPDDFGVVAAALVVVFFTEFIYEMGVGPAIVQFKDLTKEHVNAAFTFSVVLGVSLALLFYLINPLIAKFFEMPALREALNYLVWIFPMRTISQLSYSLLQRDMEFKKIAGCDVVSYGFGYGLVGISLAYYSYGIWALIWANLAQAFIYCILLIKLRRHSVQLIFDFKSLKELLRFGAGFTLSQVFNILARKADYILVGKFLGAASLGIYSKAYALMNAPNNIAGTVMSKVLFASYSKKQDSREQLTLATQKSYSILFLVTIPLGAIGIVLAPEVINFLLGPNWNESILPFQILVGFTCFRIGYKVGGTLLKSIGQVYLLSVTQFIYLILVVAGSYWGSIVGLSGVAIGVSIAIFVNFVMLVYLSFRYTSITLTGFIADFLKPTLMSLFLLGGLYGLATFMRLNNFHSVYTLLLSAITIGFFVLFLMRFKGGILLGEHGIWLKGQMLGMFLKKGKGKKNKNKNNTD